jgi:signal transduction histidine kinase
MNNAICLTELSLISDIAVMERNENGAFQLIGIAPDWLDRFFPKISLKQQEDVCYEDSPFLDQFICDAEAFWNAGVDGKLKSGAWIETDDAENEYPFEATAVLLGKRKILLIEAAQYSYEEKQEIIQKGRELALAYHRLEQAEAELKKAKQTAENASHAKSEFLANLSHELRTPLNAISGYTQVLINHASVTPFQSERLNIILKSTEHILHLINDILDLAKIEANRIEIEPAEFHLRNFLKDISEMFQIQAERKNIRFVYKSSKLLPGIVIGDERRLRQVLINLLANAIKFTEKGGVTLKAEYHNGRACFEVSDTGIGVNADELEKIFSPFYQVGYYPKITEGTGLGLSISKKLTQMMGGQLTAQSNIGQGSVFRVEMELPPGNAETEISDTEALEKQLPDKLIPPSPEELSALINLVQLGDIRTIRQRTEALFQQDKQLIPFATELLHLVKEFQMSKIRVFLKSCVKNG